MKQIRNQLGDAEKNQAAFSLMSLIKEQSFFQNAQDILIYAPVRNEISLLPFFSLCRDLEKNIYFPKTLSDLKMEFFRITSYEQLQSGNFSVMEPKGDTKQFQEQTGIIFVPALAFNRNKNRIGYGKGYYDRYLSEHPGLFKVGVGYHFQMNREFTEDEFDIPMDLLLSEIGKE